MSWILWVVFAFQDGSNLKYPLEVYDAEHQCKGAAYAAHSQYSNATPRLFPENKGNIVVSTHCLAASRI